MSKLLEVMLSSQHITGSMSSPGKVISVMDRSDINRELTPLLIDLVTLDLGNDEHPSVKKLFNYLVDPDRTGDDFAYVIGDLASEVIEKHFPIYVYEDDGPCIYLAKIAAEALAIKCPVLVGAWEAAALKVLQLWYCRNLLVFFRMYVLSNHFGGWLIHVIGDSDICPNPCLRLEFMALFFRMVVINENKRTQAIESLMSACSQLNTKRIKLSSSTVTFNEIGKIFEKFAEDGHLLEFDSKLAEELLNVKASRCYAIVHDVGYNRAKKSTRYTLPREFYGLMALLQTIDETLKDELLQYRLLEKEGEIHKFLTSIGDVSNILYLLICNFKASCQTPQLVGLTASCIIGIVELGVITKLCLEDPDIDEKICDILSEVINFRLVRLGILPRDGIEYVPSFIFTNVALEMLQEYQYRINILEDLVYGGEPSLVKEWIVD